MFGYHKTSQILFGSVAAAVLAGCGSGTGSASGPRADRADEAARLFGSAAAVQAQDTESWSIGLMVFVGPDRRALALESCDRLRESDPMLREAFVADRGDRSVVLLGEHVSPSSREALSQLERVRSLRIEGDRPFRTAFFVPPTATQTDDLDLRRARQAYGAEYTLQVGAYGRADAKPLTEKELREVRESAEEAVRRLRREGELAFYYHGTSLSMVTVGAFRQADLEQGSMELEALRQRFPHNLLNGAGIRQRVMTETGETWVLQPSFPVAVPES